MTVVGVVGDVRQDGPADPAYPQIYCRWPRSRAGRLLIALRTEGDPLALVPSLRRGARRGRSQPRAGRIATMDDRLAGTLARPRVNALLLAGFAATALLLAALGIYGVIAYSVVQRTRELGIRMALGARARRRAPAGAAPGDDAVAVGLRSGWRGAAAASRVLQRCSIGVGGDGSGDLRRRGGLPRPRSPSRRAICRRAAPRARIP